MIEGDIKEYKRFLEKLKTAKKLSDLIEPYTPPQPLTIAVACDRVTKFIEDYAKDYGDKLCLTLDLIVYFNLNGYYVDDKDISTNVSEMKKQGWRSVSIVSNSNSFIFFALENAPVFLKKAVGNIKREWKGSGLFELN